MFPGGLARFTCVVSYSVGGEGVGSTFSSVLYGAVEHYPFQTPAPVSAPGRLLARIPFDALSLVTNED